MVLWFDCYKLLFLRLFYEEAVLGALPPHQGEPTAAMAGFTKVMRSTTAPAYGAYLFGSCSGDPAGRHDPRNISLWQSPRGSCCALRPEGHSSSAVAPGILLCAAIRGTFLFGSCSGNPAVRRDLKSIRLRGLRRDGISQMSNASVWPFPLALNRVVRNQLWERIQALRPVASLRRRRVMCMR